MRLFSGLFIILGLVILTGCSGAGDAAQSSVDTDLNSGAGSSEPNPAEPAQPPAEPVTPVSPNPTTPTPGDIVASSEPDPKATYPSLGQPVQQAPDPKVEPNTDYVVPVIGITAQPDPYIPNKAGTIQLQAADNEGGAGLKDIQCSVDGSAYSSCGEQVDMSNLSEGLHTVTARAEDWDDNVSSEVSYTFYVDTTPPAVEVVKTPSAATTDPNASFEFDASDDGSGVSHYRCQVDTGAVANCNDKEAFQGLPEGHRTLTVKAVDNVGNKSPDKTYNWTIDHSAPIIDFVQQPSSTVYIDDADPVVNLNVMDRYSPNGVATNCTLNGKAIACAPSTPLTIPATEPAEFTLVVTSTDVLGNTSSSTITWRAVNEAENRSTAISVNDVQPVDILFVVDNSGSMSYERSNLAQRIDGLISVIDGLDWQIAVASTDATNNNAQSNGLFVELEGMPGQYILDSSMDVAQAQAAFGNTVQNFPGGSGREEGIHVSKLVIDRYIAGETNHRQFIRPNSDLSIVVLSDEDESSNGVDIRTTPQGFLNHVNNTFNNQKNVVFHSIITRPGDSSCLNGEGAYYGNVYDELSRLTGYGDVGGAIIGSVCEDNYTAQLADIGQSVKDLKNSIKLKCSPFDADKDGTPEVTVSFRKDASSAYSVYNASRTISGDRVVFDDLLPPGDYKADYKCKVN